MNEFDHRVFLLLLKQHQSAMTKLTITITTKSRKRNFKQNKIIKQFTPLTIFLSFLRCSESEIFMVNCQ